jgi:SAM-dependent methyltransferase
LAASPSAIIEAQPMISVKDLLRRHSPDDLNRKAEEYFAKIEDRTYLLSKPFAAIEECSKLLFNFAALLQGLRLFKYMDVMEFGAGPCWCSHLLTQLGCKVYAVDVSPTALEIGQDRYARHPPFGEQPAPEFLAYDGYRLPLPDDSVDRILCYDAFHHVPNPEHLIGEMARVLRRDGVAGFAEPGPEHSACAESQMEMEAHGVLERDIVVEEIWRRAQEAGFQRLELSALSLKPVRLGLADYDRFVAGPSPLDGPVVDSIRYHARSARMFFLGKEESPVPDSRTAEGLVADLEVTLPQGTSYRAGEPILATVRVRNTSPSVWLPTTARLGAVHLGAHLFEVSRRRLDNDYFRATLTPGEGVPVRPGEDVAFDTRIPCPPPGSYDLELDLVSEQVIWFAFNKSGTCKFRIEVEPEPGASSNQAGPRSRQGPPGS